MAIGAALIMLGFVVQSAAVDGARTPFSDDGVQNMAVTKKKADCKADYDTRMRISEQHYGPPLKQKKEQIDRLTRDINVINAQKVVSVAVIALLKTKMTQRTTAMHEYDALMSERKKKEAEFKKRYDECITRAKTGK